MPDQQKIEQSSNEDSIKPKKVRIHTMPEKFYLEDKKSGGNKNLFVIAGIIVILLLIGGGAYYFFTQQGNTNENTNEELNANQANENSEDANDNLNETNDNTNLANDNENTNSNANVNADTNTNSSINVNLLNIFGNTNVNTNTALNVNTVAGGQDSDSDGLSDVEESLFGTSISIADTDSDSFADGQEVINGYNPNGSGALTATTYIRSFFDTEEGYSVYYPAGWVVGSDPQDERGTMISTSGEFITVNVQENPARLAARDWYLSKSPGIDSARIVTFQNWDKTLLGAISLDGLTVYYSYGINEYVISYNVNILSQADYKTIFEMLYKSFAISTSTPTNSNTNASSNSNSNTNTNTNLNSNSNTNTNINSNTNTNNNSNTNSIIFF